MKYYLIAGEASGDLHASNLMKALKNHDSSAEFRFWGGDKMKTVGGELVQHFKDISYMGFWEVFTHLFEIKKKLKQCKQDVISYNPDALILVDYPGFNLRIAQFAKNNGLKVFYYISPKIWAWNTSRIEIIKKAVDRVFTIFPFEQDFYKKYDYEADYIGHPLIEEINEFKKNDNFISENQLGANPIIALLPGSRKQEITKTLSVMTSVKSQFPDYTFVIGGLLSIDKNSYEPFIGDSVKIVFDKTYDLLSFADAAIITSGTANLEAALLDVPQVVCYKTSLLTYLIAKAVIKVDYISPVNLVMKKEVVKELIQDDCNSSSVTEELEKILNDSGYKAEILENYRVLQDDLRLNEPSSEKAAKIISEELN
ncbi:MAG: lipid-A-disaccharide synthase [Bacteroidetes bacterium]|nr:MAG: lipid-A-disaccharide synthase [Bacteroidota bacterium]